MKSQKVGYRASGLFGVLLAVLAAGASAQTVPYEVTINQGEWEKTIPGRRFSGAIQDLRLSVAAPTFCRIPTNEAVKARIQALASNNTLAARLADLEAIGSGDVALLQGLRGLMGSNDMILEGGTKLIQLSSSPVNAKWSAGEPFVYQVAPACLSAEETRAWALALRGAIRAYLGFPPVTAAPQ